MFKSTHKKILLTGLAGVLDELMDAIKWVLIITLALLITTSLLFNKYSEKTMMHPGSFEEEPLEVKTFKC